ncbi:hypothetical protein [Ruegeria sp. HKCCA4633]|uniref:hypothetical protein n=1 Tax=Ruegeria sp. HKCCA4633 TaxID=2682983 RepID=UPI0014899554|nr:hypothetical protein [Ruegeria sp. HKCCA4633]
MQFVSYAKNFENVLLWGALGQIENGFYIDTGANSPDEGALTRAFYDKVWHGINIEANPRFITELSDRRLGDKNLGVAIIALEGNIQFHNFVENPGLAPLNTDVAKTHR